MIRIYKRGDRVPTWIMDGRGKWGAWLTLAWLHAGTKHVIPIGPVSFAIEMAGPCTISRVHFHVYPWLSWLEKRSGGGNG